MRSNSATTPPSGKKPWQGLQNRFSGRRNTNTNNNNNSNNNSDNQNPANSSITPHSSSSSLSSMSQPRGGETSVKETAAANSNQRLQESLPPPAPPLEHDACMINALHYRGLDVIFVCTVTAEQQPRVMVVAARTRAVLQYLSVPADAGHLVAITSHPVNGMVCLAFADGRVVTYFPKPARAVPTRTLAETYATGTGAGTGAGTLRAIEQDTPYSLQDERLYHDPKEPLTVFGRYFWLNGAIAHCKSVFYAKDEMLGQDIFARTQSVSQKDPKRVLISLSVDFKLLVGHKDQLAVFDASPSDTPDEAAILNWTYRLRSYIQMAKISGDALAIAYVLHGDNKMGVYTLIRERGLADMDHAMDIDSADSNNMRSSGPVLTALFYKSGPFLNHSAGVTRLAFRGRGYLNTKVVPDDEEEGVTLYGNDLLLTTCSTDGSMRIFGQSNWKQLYQWDTPPGNSRADWIQGITFFNVGELEGTSSSSTTTTTTTTASNTTNAKTPHDDNSTSSFSESLRDMRNKHQNGIVTSQAGAWISELTFRGNEPALRLSRLSFVKSGGNDFTPAHFESIIATLPPGSISHSSVQRFMGGDEDSSLIVHGLWPAWDPWENTTTTTTTLPDAKLVPPPSSSPTASPAVTSAGVTHQPPTELRIYASDILGNNAVILEFPLWGDKSSGEFELGSPLRYALKINDFKSSSPDCTNLNDDLRTSIEMSSGRLCTWVHKDSTSVEILWRAPGTMNILRDDTSLSMETYVDVSATPLPLSIATCTLPEELHQDTIALTRWWHDENFGESCRLLVLTTSGSFVIYEVPPIWSALEPIPSASNTIIEYSASVGDLLSLTDKRKEAGRGSHVIADGGRIYETEIMPHPEYGLGIRLDVHREGQRIIVGSFKKHPLTGEMLPAEKLGKVKVGDIVLKVNNISFEGKSMNEIVDIMKSFGTKNPLAVAFRTVDETDLNSTPISLHSSSCINTLGFIQNGISNQIPRDISSFIILPRPFGQNIPTAQRTYLGTTLVVFASRGTLTAYWLHISNSKSSDMNNANLTNVGTLDLNSGNSATKTLHIVDMDILEVTPTSWNIVVCDDLGYIVIIMIHLTVTSDSSVAFPTINMKVMEAIDSEKSHENAIVKTQHLFHLRTYSVDLFATLRSKGDTVTIWSSNHAGNIMDRSKSVSIGSKYTSSTISSNTVILDFQFMHSGFLDAFPWLVIFSTSALSLYRFNLIKSEWTLVLDLKYASTKCSSNYDCYHIRDDCLKPLDEYPHLIPSLKRLICYSDESSACRSDWHPDALIAYICTNPSGSADAIKRTLPQIYGDLTSSMSFNNLACTPTYFFTNTSEFAPIHENILKGDDVSILGKEGDLHSIIDRLAAVIERTYQRGIATPENPCKQGSKDFISVMTGRKNTPESDNKILLDTLTDMGPDNSLLLCSIGKIMLKNRDLSKVDRQGQIFSFSYDLMRQLQAEYSSKYGGSGSTISSTISTPATQDPSTPNKILKIASAASLAALLSDTQGQILKATKSSEEKMDWNHAKSMLLPFWLRSDKVLRSLVEEIGLEVYRKTRDIMESAIFMISSGNIKKLKALAATDRSDSGRKFLSFISDNDFSSTRGRAAAEKNAFSLLRKRRYIVAAAFFLLAQPPMLKNATEIILTQLDDPSLAFMVTRLMGDSSDSTIAGGLSSLTITNLRGMGGGGGFASGSTDYDDSNPSETEEKFSDWKPSPNESMRFVLSSRCLPSNEKDGCLQAAIMLWLNRPNDAFRCLIGRAFKSTKDHSDTVLNGAAPLLCDDEENKTILADKEIFSMERVISRCNNLMGLVCRPFLLATMNAPHSVVTASTLASSDALYRRGLEMPSLLILLDAPRQLSKILASKDKSQEKEQIEGSSSFNSVTGRHVKISSNVSSSDASSSIFDSFSVPQTTAKKPLYVGKDLSTENNSSIFDSFSAPPVRKTVNISTKTEQSSIFDSFDVPPPKKDSSNTIKATAGTENSSIFDTFDAPKQTKKVISSLDPMTSSIFDSFDSPPPKANKPVTGTDRSSIFDSFDVPTQAKKAIPSADPMTSSIFDSFDTKPRHVTNHTVKPTSIDVFGPQQKAIPSDRVNENKSLASKFNFGEEETESVIKIDFDDHPITNVLQAKILRISTARRLLREMSRLISAFHGDVEYDSMDSFYRHIHPLVPIRFTKMFSHKASEGLALMQSIKKVLDYLSLLTGLEASLIIDEALLLLGCPKQPRRITFSVLLISLKGRNDLIEDTLIQSSQEQIRHCEMLIISNDDLTFHHKSKHYASSHFVRRYAVVTSLQLEFCLWLHRSSIFPMSPSALKEVAIGVRAGILVASWGRCHEVLEDIIRSDPDCKLDSIRGHQLWSTMKVMNANDEEEKKAVLSSTGGWEFLVDCRRAEATELLRDRKAGSFLIRPKVGDQGVFTLSFKTNLQSSDSTDEGDDLSDKKIMGKLESSIGDSSTSQVPMRDDIVQHAIIRLSEAGFRCGHFGPFSSLQQLLEEISASLPFHLLFSQPPSMAMVRNKSDQPSPNAAMIQKLASHGTLEHLKWNSETRLFDSGDNKHDDTSAVSLGYDDRSDKQASHFRSCNNLMISGLFSQLLTLAQIRTQLCSIAAADYEVSKHPHRSSIPITHGSQSLSEATLRHDTFIVEQCEEDFDLITSRIMRPLLTWCRVSECGIVHEIAPPTSDIWVNYSGSNRIAVTASDTEVEAIPSEMKQSISRGDALIRLMIQPSSGVTFRTMRVGDGGQSVVVVLFSRNEAISWLISIGIDQNEEDAAKRLAVMERRRVIEVIELNENAIGNRLPTLGTNIEASGLATQSNDVRYRFVDPWEVEVLDSNEGDSKAAALGRGHYTPSSLETVARASETVQRSLGGLHLVELWNAVKGGISLTKAITSVYPPWERDSGGDSPVGFEVHFSNFANSFSQHLYRNALFRRLGLPQRFIAVINAELLDLKNLTSPTGAAPVVAFALARLKRPSSNAPLNLKARTIDSACTEPKKIGKASGPNAPCTWGSFVRFRFPLPEDVDCDGVSFDHDRETLFKGIPSLLQVTVYEKKFMTDSMLGGADVSLDGLPGDGQVVEWVPLRSSQQANVTWFIRIRLSLRFELMCLEPNDPSISADYEGRCPSVAVRRLKALSSAGGAQEDKEARGFRKILSAPDIPDHFD